MWCHPLSSAVQESGIKVHTLILLAARNAMLCLSLRVKAEAKDALHWNSLRGKPEAKDAFHQKHPSRDCVINIKMLGLRQHGEVGDVFTECRRHIRVMWWSSQGIRNELTTMLERY